MSDETADAIRQAARSSPCCSTITASAERFAPRGSSGPIGVIYRPDTERVSHYFPARIADQFDAVIHIDETHFAAEQQSY